MTKLRQRMMEELRLRNSSEETIRSYVYSVERFARYYHTSPDRMTAEHVRSYLLYLLEERKLSWSAIHVNRAALRFLYVRVLRRRWFDKRFKRPSGARNCRPFLAPKRSPGFWKRRGICSTGPSWQPSMPPACAVMNSVC